MIIKLNILQRSDRNDGDCNIMGRMITVTMKLEERFGRELVAAEMKKSLWRLVAQILRQVEVMVKSGSDGGA